MEHLLRKLREQDIIIALENNDLKVKFNGSGLPPELLAELKANKAAIVKYLADLSAPANNGEIRKLELHEHYPLSSSQLRVFMLSQFEEANFAYNIPAAFVFEGQLDLAALEASFKAVIARHEILRTAFRDNELDGIGQFIVPAEDVPFKLAYTDVRNREDRDVVVKKAVQEEISRPFDLAALPLLRAGIYQLAVDKWVCSYVMHHIISDGWSMDLLIQELLLYYNGFISGETPVLPPLRIQYKDYAFWHNQQLKGVAMETHRSWWLKQLEGELPVLALPGDKPRPSVKTYNGGTVVRRINPVMTRGLKTLCHQNDTSLFTGLLTLVNIVLYRYTGQEEMIIGTPTAGRDHIELEEQLGLYLNTLALRCSCKGEANFRDLLAHNKTVALGAFEHQVYPFEKLVEDMQVHRDMSRSPLFDVMLILQNANVKSGGMQFKLGDCKISDYPFREYGVSKYDLTFDFAEFGHELQTTIEYNSDLFHESTIVQLLHHLEQLLQAVIVQPLIPVRQLDYLSVQEKQQLLFQFNDTDAAYPKNSTWAILFEEQAERTPDHVAVVCNGKIITYRSLNERSNQLARYLRDTCHLLPDELVVICVNRSEYMLIGMLAILKAGGAYVPVDPEYPADRIEYVLKDAQPKAVLINKISEERWHNLTGEINILVACIDDAGFLQKLADHETGNLPGASAPHNLQYVIYTSGSTGRPKGVMVEQSAYVNLLFYYKNNFFKEDDLISTFSITNYVFDIWGLEYGLPLMSGGYIELAGSEFETLETAKYTFLQMTPGLLLTKYEAIQFNNPRLKLLVGGEAVPDKLLKKILNNHTIDCLLNVYGPTETTIWSINQVNTSDHFNTNIGKPIANTYVYILDDTLAPVPIGAAGELYIGGAGVARGYLNNPSLTAERFIADPFKTGQRIYRTGDTGRWLADGTIAFIGRRDGQVKINGYRIETGEIETVLHTFDGVDAAVVVAKTNTLEEKQLVAYVTGKATLNTSELRAWLANRLPAYMIPARIIQLPELPLNANGKVDKKRLPEPKEAGADTGTAYLLPRNQIEEQLVMIWQELLGDVKIGVNDNFFDLGGNSMKLLRMVMISNKTFDQKLTIATAFRYSNISTLAAYLTNGNRVIGGESDKAIDSAFAVMEETFNILNDSSYED
jgi:amino acid adenylation domain-containing protein